MVSAHATIDRYIRYISAISEEPLRVTAELTEIVQYTNKLNHEFDSHISQYHLQFISLKQAPVKWICEACEASGPAQAAGKTPMEVISYYLFRKCA